MSGFFFGPLGAMIPVDVSAGATVESDRGFSEFVSAGGVRHVQLGRAAPRVWQLSRLWQNPDWARLLSMAAHGILADCWLYDVAAARDNMLPARQSVGDSAQVLVNGIPMGGIENGRHVQVPVLAGRNYTISVWTDAGDGQPVFSFQPANAPLATVRGVQGRGARYVAEGFTALTDGTLDIRILRQGCSGLRVHEGPPDGMFYVGHGTPCRVTVRDPARTLQMVTDQTRSDYSITLLEVGRTGQI